LTSPDLAWAATENARYTTTARTLSFFPIFRDKDPPYTLV
jgi:hypothetical protein